MKILVVGLGGVGGYYGGLLAHKYADNPEVQIDFLVRGAHLRAIRERGLKVIDGDTELVAHPHLATDDVAQVGVVDCVVMCTKSYDLRATVEQFRPCVGEHTVILPLLNGVEIAPIIREMLPQSEVWEGCTYIVGRRVESGVVASTGAVSDVYFGYQNTTSDRLIAMETLWREAGINMYFRPDILNVVWKKYSFISTSASLTSYFDVSFGALLTGDERKSTLVTMLRELIAVAQAEGVGADESWIDFNIQWLERLPFATTSSMHTDFTNKYKTEVENLTGAVVRMAHKHGIEVPTYDRVYARLLALHEANCAQLAAV